MIWSALVLLCALACSRLPAETGTAIIATVSLAGLLVRREAIDVRRLAVLALVSAAVMLHSAGVTSCSPSGFLPALVACGYSMPPVGADRTRLLCFAAAAATITGIAGLLGIITTKGIGPAGLFTNSNHFAAFIELAVPVVLWCALTDAPRRYCWVVAAAFLAFAVAAAGARAGVVLVAIEIVCFFALTRGHTGSGAVRRALAVGLLAAVCTGGFALVASRYITADYFTVRLAALRSTVRIIADRPLGGWGPDSFRHVYPAYADQDFGAAVLHAHNDWLEFAAEYGAPVALVVAAAAAFVAWRSRRVPWALGLPAVFVHAAVEFPLHDVALAVWAASIAAMCCSPTMVVSCGLPLRRSTAPSGT